MHKLIALLAVMFSITALTLAPVEQADAKRFGFGKSFGKQYSAPKSAPGKQTAGAAPASGQAAAAGRTGASRWLGPLAGLAAGGLLAALIFGDAFEGLQLMDFLLFAGLLLGFMALFRAMRRQATQAGAPGGLATGPAGRLDAGGDAGFGAQAIDNALVSAPIDAPRWFDTLGFADGAKTHFLRLQAAWDKRDFRDIAEYTTPELFAQIQAEQLQRSSEADFTEVVSLDAKLLAVQRDGDLVIASVGFSGLIREDRDAVAQPFSEIWHVQHAWDDAAGDWFIAGIEQA